MKIRQLNLWTTGGLILLTGLLVVTVIWGLKQLQATAAATQTYYQLKNKVNDRLKGAIDTYLLTGDSLMLSEAEAELSRFIEEDSAHFSIDLQQALLPIADDLKQRLSVDLRAAGKLSGNTTALLDQAEMDMMATIAGLEDYAKTATDRDRILYLQKAGNLSRDVYALSVARDKLMTTMNAALSDNVKQHLRTLQSGALELTSFPELGVYIQEEQDEMEALLWSDDESETATEEKGTLLKQELNNLISRYPQELDRTMKWLKQGQQARESVQEQVNLLLHELASGEAAILQRRDSIEQQVSLLMIAASSLMILLAMGVFVIQHRMAGTLVRVNADIASLAAGDFRGRAVQSSRITELSGLLTSYQVLRQSLATMVADIQQQCRDIKVSSDEVSDSSRHICRLTEQQREQSALANQSVIEVTDSVRHVAEQTASASLVAQEATQIVFEGQHKIDVSLDNIECLGKVITRTGDALSTLQSDAQSINSFVEVIQSIAEQTNLLALNAAIEAARAGEQGRGFSVVADEVRSLAGKTNDATHEIQRLVEQVSQSSHSLSSAMGEQLKSSTRTAEASREAGEAYQRLMVSVGTINDVISGIAVQSEQQAQIVDGVSAGIHSVAEMALVSSQQSEASLVVSDDLKQISGAFTQLTQGYRI